MITHTWLYVSNIFFIIGVGKRWSLGTWTRNIKWARRSGGYGYGCVHICCIDIGLTLEVLGVKATRHVAFSCSVKTIPDKERQSGYTSPVPSPIQKAKHQKRKTFVHTSRYTISLHMCPFNSTFQPTRPPLVLSSPILPHLNPRPERLIRRRPRGSLILMRPRPLLHLMSLLASKRRTSDPLIRIRSLLNGNLLMGALATAAADADKPEEARGNAKRDSEPERGQHAGTH